MQRLESEQPILRRSESVQSALPLMETGLVDYHLPTADLSWDNSDLSWPKTNEGRGQQQQQQMQAIELQDLGDTATANPISTQTTDNEGFVSQALECPL